MADSVDTMIVNSYSRAQSWGVWSNVQAFNAVKGVNSFKRPKLTAAVNPPKSYAKNLTLPKQPTNQQLQAFRQQVQDMLDDFFADHFSPADAYDAAVDWIIDTLSTNDPKMPGNNLNIIWGRAESNTVGLGNELTGLDLPQEAFTPHVASAYAAFTHAEAYARGAAKVDLWQHAVALKLRDIRAEAITATGEYIRALAAADLAVSSEKVAILEAEARLKTTAAAWYVAQLGPTLRDTERKIGLTLQGRADDMAITDLNSQYAELAVSTAIGGAQAVAKAAQAATASLNSIISSSTVGFA